MNDITYTAHFCDSCIDAAQTAIDDEGDQMLAYVAGQDANIRAYFLIKILEMHPDAYALADHACESNNGACDCVHEHEYFNEDEENEDQ